MEFDMFHLVFLISVLSVAFQGSFLPWLARITNMIDENVDIRKKLSLELAKENITIFEMKKADATLEDAFIKIIEGGNK